MSTFGITTAGDYFDQLVLPSSEAFLGSNASSAKALVAILAAYHLYEWANPGEEYSAPRFRPKYPTRHDMIEFFELARMLANGTKHFVPTKPWHERAVTNATVGYSQDFSDDFKRPLNVETTTAGKWISADDLVKKIVAFWQDERTAGRF